jgi:hypothetical protein
LDVVLAKFGAITEKTSVSEYWEHQIDNVVSVIPAQAGIQRLQQVGGYRIKSGMTMWS